MAMSTRRTVLHESWILGDRVGAHIYWSKSVSDGGPFRYSYLVQSGTVIL